MMDVKERESKVSGMEIVNKRDWKSSKGRQSGWVAVAKGKRKLK